MWPRGSSILCGARLSSSFQHGRQLRDRGPCSQSSTATDVLWNSASRSRSPIHRNRRRPASAAATACRAFGQPRRTWQDARHARALRSVPFFVRVAAPGCSPSVHPGLRGDRQQQHKRTGVDGGHFLRRAEGLPAPPSTVSVARGTTDATFSDTHAVPQAADGRPQERTHPACPELSGSQITTTPRRAMEVLSYLRSGGGPS